MIRERARVCVTLVRPRHRLTDAAEQSPDNSRSGSSLYPANLFAPCSHPKHHIEHASTSNQAAEASSLTVGGNSGVSPASGATTRALLFIPRLEALLPSPLGLLDSTFRQARADCEHHRKHAAAAAAPSAFS